MTQQELKEKHKITLRMAKFADEYIKTGIGNHSAETAGYSKKTSEAKASQLLADPRIKAYIRERTENLADEGIASMKDVLEYLTRVMRGEEKDAFDLDPSLAERTRAAQELMRRLGAEDNNKSTQVVIINDIPRPEKPKPGKAEQENE